MKKKGFTLIELLVVISIIALLMAILMPALAKVRAIAARVVCGSHLSGLGKAIMLYADGNHGKYPRAGGRDSLWGARILQWNPPQDAIDDELQAYGTPPERPATISSCLYLLVKYYDASLKQLICGGDTSATAFNLARYTNNPPVVTNNDTMEAWDLGGAEPGGAPSETIPRTHYSYAYQIPFGRTGTTAFPMTSLSDSGMAIMADKNPYIVTDSSLYWDAEVYYIWREIGGSKTTERWGNSPNHAQDGQNVLFNDGHVSFHDVPYCGFDSDNIYSMAKKDEAPNVETGMEPWPIPAGTTTVVDVRPYNKNDSILVNEGLPCVQNYTDIAIRKDVPPPI